MQIVLQQILRERERESERAEEGRKKSENSIQDIRNNNSAAVELLILIKIVWHGIDVTEAKSDSTNDRLVDLSSPLPFFEASCICISKVIL